MVISPQNSRLGLIALTKRIGLVDRPDSSDGEMIRYRVYSSLEIANIYNVYALYCESNSFYFFFVLVQWDDPQVIPANMTLEVSELFTRELTRVILICFVSIFLVWHLKDALS